MNIAIDLDGVVFNSEMYFMAAAEIYDCMVLGKNSLIKPDEPRVQKKYGWTQSELDGYISRYANSDEFDIMPCAKIVIDALKAKNKLYIISARGQFNPQEIELAKSKLSAAGITFDEYIFGHLDKTDIVLDNDIKIMIEDRYDVCEQLSKCGVLCLYFRMAGRKKIKDNPLVIEVNNWGEVYRVLYGRGVI